MTIISHISVRRPRPRFRLFLLARAVSWAGSAVTLVALPVLLYQRTGSPALTGLLTALEAVPYLLLGLPAGALVDRWDQRRTLVATSWLSAAVMASIPVASALGILTTPQLLAAALLTSATFVFFDAAGFGVVPALVGRRGCGHRDHDVGQHRHRAARPGGRRRPRHRDRPGAGDRGRRRVLRAGRHPARPPALGGTSRRHYPRWRDQSRYPRGSALPVAPPRHPRSHASGDRQQPHRRCPYRAHHRHRRATTRAG